MGTTIVAGVIHEDWLIVANVGDSRAYLVRGDLAQQITRDHSWVADQVQAGTLTPQQAETHIYRNIVTRCLGHRPSISVDVFERPLEPGDVILLCSDGLSNMVSDDEIARVLHERSPKRAADDLIALANQRGGPDNITALIIAVKAAQGVERALRQAQDAVTQPLPEIAVHEPLQGESAPQADRTPGPTPVRARSRSVRRYLFAAVVALSVLAAALGASSVLFAVPRWEWLRNLILLPVGTPTPVQATATAANPAPTSTLPHRSTATLNPLPTSTTVPSATPTHTPTLTNTPTPSPSPGPSATATRTATATHTPSPTTTRTPFPTEQPRPGA
jgi:protein phosphatase